MRALLTVLLLGVPRVAAGCEPLFVVERSSNANVVVYEAVRAPGGVVDPKQPVAAHWRLWAKDGRREELSGIERRLAYGVDVVSAGSAGTFEIAVRALRERTIEVRTAEPCPTAWMTIGGRPARLRRVFVSLARGFFLFPRVAWVELHGEDPETKAVIEERIDVSRREQPSGAAGGG